MTSVSAHRVGAGRLARVRISPLATLGGLIALYLALPLAAFVIRFLSSRQRGFSVPGLFPSLWMSLSCATISLGLVTVFGVPLAFVLARSTSRWSKIVGVIVQIPLALPPLMSGIVLIYIIGPYTFLGRLFDRELTNSRAGIVIAMTFVAAPFLIVAARAAFVSLDQGMLDVARTLGHSETSRFVHVAVPIAGPSIRAGMLLTWLRAFGEYGAVVVLAYNPTSLPIYTYNQFSGVGLSTTLAPTALAMLVAVVAVIVSRVSWPLRRHHSRVTSFAPVAPRSTNAPDALERQSIAFHADARVGSFHLEVNHTTVSHLSVLGPSGSGKSLLLRSLAGLHEATYELRCNGETLSERRVSDRPVGYVAQGFSLFPHLTVWQQLLFARHATVELATYWCERLQLGGLEDRFPAQLSGGQRQRVALAQALTNSPRVLLLDEPFSALDSPVRHELQRLVRHLQHETRLSTILVTHDPEEAALLAQDIIVLNEGHALQSGSVREVFTHPASASAARLLGMTNIFEAAVTSDKTLDVAGVIVRTPTSLSAGTRLTCSVRPELVTLERPAPEQRGGDPLDAVTSTQRAVVNDVADIGTAWIVFVTLGDVEIQARGDNTIGLRAGDECDVSFPPGALRIWPAGTDQTTRSHTDD